jgi:hypothetical protein
MGPSNGPDNVVMHNILLIESRKLLRKLAWKNCHGTRRLRQVMTDGCKLFWRIQNLQKIINVRVKLMLFLCLIN